MPSLDLRKGVPGPASAAIAELGGRAVVMVRVDGTDRRGALRSADSETIAAAAQMALAKRLPFVGVLESSGADVHEGIAALDGWGRAAHVLSRCSGVVPVLLLVTGPALSGPALLLGLADIVVMTDEAYAWVSGPAAVEQFTGISLDRARLGGSRVHARSSGVASASVTDEEAGLEVLAAAISYLPDHTDDHPPVSLVTDPVDRAVPELDGLLPSAATGSYDVRRVIRAVADEGEFLELRAGWAQNLVTGLAAVGGRPVGVVANQPQSLAGTLDIPASQKGARFVQFCDSFNLPIVTLVDTPGFYPGKDLEWRGMIRHGAQLVFAYAEATVPRICVILRKAYGGAYIVMDCKTMGNDICLAWPSAEIAVMGAKGAVAILHRDLDPAQRAEIEQAYERTHLTPYLAAERGLVDAIIAPSDTRRLLGRWIDVLSSKREQLAHRMHSNTPM